MSKENHEALDQPVEISESQLAEVAAGLDVNGQGDGANRILLAGNGNDVKGRGRAGGVLLGDRGNDR